MQRGRLCDGSRAVLSELEADARDSDDFDQSEEWYESMARQACDAATEARLERMAELAMAAEEVWSYEDVLRNEA